MPAQWTAEVIGKMHLYGITAKELAEFAGYHPKYLSAVLNGRVEPKRAEQTLSDALNRMIEEKESSGNKQKGGHAAQCQG